MTTFYLPVDRSGGVPLHRQIYRELRRAILDGKLLAGWLCSTGHTRKVRGCWRTTTTANTVMSVDLSARCKGWIRKSA
jgi:hypothetical protein